MRVLFYVSTEGEVLSNKDFPVDKPLCIIPEIEGPPRPWFGAAASALEMSEARIKQKLYKAVWIDLPDDFFAPKDGIIT